LNHHLRSLSRFPVLVAATVLAIIAIGLPAPEPAHAIIGGQSAGDTMPAIPALVFDPGTSHPLTPKEYCTGVLIDPSWVLTAQHCTNLNEQQGHPFLPREVTVTFTSTFGTKEVRKVRQIQRAPGYDSGTGVGDVALLKLSAPVTDISPMPLLGSGQSGSLSQVQRFGYGITSPSGTKPSKVLNYSVEGVWHVSSTSGLPVKINPNCGSISWPVGNALWTYDIGKGGSGKGDSGGPVIDDFAPGSYAVAGITEGTLDLRDCTVTKYDPNTLGRQYLGFSNRVDQGSAEWGFISGLIPGVGVLSPGGWTATRAGLPAGVDPTQGMTLNSMSCPSAGICTVAGSTGGIYSEPLLEMLSGGSWSDTGPPLPPDAYPYNQTAFLTSVSCADTSTCVAIGQYEDANTSAGLIETGAGGNWAATRAPVPPGVTGDPYATLNTVTCVSATSCVALGTYNPSAGFDGMIDTFNGQGWSSVPAPLPADASATDPEAYLVHLSCPTFASCVAAGSYADASGDTKGVIESYHNGSWTPTVLPLPADAATSGQFDPVQGLACPAAGSCVAAGNYETSTGIHGFLAQLSGGTWSTVEAPLPADASPGDPGVDFGSFSSQGGTSPVACSASGPCVAVGWYYSNSNIHRPLIEQLTGGTWAAVQAPLPPGYVGGSGYLNSAECPSAGTCIVGGSATANGNTTGLVDALANGNWTAVPVALPQDSASPPSGFIWNADCTASGFCAAAGGYYASDGTNQGLLVTSG
jgi:trypsin